MRVLSRAAFLCNICFIFAVILLGMKHPPGGGPVSGFISQVIIMGFFLSVILNAAAGIGWLIQRLKRSPTENRIPRWLLVTNGCFLIIQLILLIV